MARGAILVSERLPQWAGSSLLIAVLLAGGLGVRLWQITSPPLEFHPARQFMGANIARLIYLTGRPGEPEWRLRVAERNVRNENLLEPHLLERMVVMGYRIAGGEELWIARVLSITFWLLGAVLLYRIGVRLTSMPSALVGVVVYLFMPFAIMASRTFQPDPLMICLQLAGTVALLRFVETETTQRMAVAAILCALAVLVKPFCIFALVGVYGVSSLYRHGLLRTLTSRHTFVLGGALCLPVAYYLWRMFWHSADNYLAGQAEASILPGLLLTVTFWRGVAVMLSRVLGFAPVLLALIGWSLTVERHPYRGTLTGMWLGYAGVVLVFTYHTHTHDYYHLQLIPVAALSLGPLTMAVVGAMDCSKWASRGRLLSLTAATATMLLLVTAGVLGWRRTHGHLPGAAKQAIKVAGAVLGVPHKTLGFLRPSAIGLAQDAAAARAAGQAVAHSMHTVFLGTHEGTPLVYLGEFSGVRWPSYGGLRARQLRGQRPMTADQRLREMLEREPALEYFVVTDFGDLAQQPDLQSLLSGLPVVAKGPGYAVYSLRH